MGKPERDLGGGLLHPEGPAGHLEPAWETSLKVTMVKIELVWEGMENSCSCLGLGAREADGQARGWDRELRPRIFGTHPSFARLQRAEAGREGGIEYGTPDCMRQAQGSIYTTPYLFQGTCVYVCVLMAGEGESRPVKVALAKAPLNRWERRGSDRGRLLPRVTQ